MRSGEKCSRCLRKVPSGQRYCSACLREMAENDRRSGDPYVRTSRTYTPGYTPQPAPPVYDARRQQKRKKAVIRQGILLLAGLLLLLAIAFGTGSLLHHLKEKKNNDAVLSGENGQTQQEIRPQDTDNLSPEQTPLDPAPDSEDAPENPDAEDPSPSQDVPDEPSSPAEPEPTPADIRQQAAEEIPYFSQRWFLNQVSDAVLADFLTLYRDINNFAEKCYLSDTADTQRVELLFFLVRKECPEVFQLDDSTSYTLWRQGEKVSYVEPHYRMTQEQYQGQLALCKQQVQRIAQGTENLSQWDKELHAYDYLTGHCVYDKESANAGSAYGALVEGKAKCDGISRAMKWIAEEMGMTCLLLSGGGIYEDVGHAWNCIQVDGRFYDLDVTSDTPFPEEELHRHYSGFNVARSLLTSQYDLRENYALFDLPGTDSMSGSWHAKNGSLFDSCGGWDALLNSLYTQVQQTGEGTVRMQFTPPELLAQAKEQLQAELKQWQQSQSFSSRYSISSRETHGSLWLHMEKAE